MKKIFTLMLLAMACTLNIQAQEYNLFDPADVDADGWLWFDTDEKIEKYVGICNEEDYKIDPDGKLIQLVYADILPDYPTPYADSWFVGAGTDGELEGEGALTGTILLPVSSQSMSANGGGIALKLPSCKSLSICVSATGQMTAEVKASKDINTSFTNYTTIKSYLAGFRPLVRSGIFYWTGIETFHNNMGDETDYTLQSDAPIFPYIINTTSARELMIHGIKVMTTTVPAGIEEESVAGKDKIFFFNNTISLNEEAQIEVYNVAGVLVESAFASRLSLEDMNKGIYLVKVGNNTRKVAVK
ncbi:MAG: T9SS type A sorting domain-containing protein [Bacteroidales bacterium]|nr:T9SS type A sorting domain-containing protein [Bacteroidales bacterium]